MHALLIDDHAMFREALGLLIGARFPALVLHQAGSLAAGQDALLRRPELQLVLLDLSLPDASGPDAITRLRAQAPWVRVVVLSADDRAETVAQAIELGACGFVPKTAHSELLVQALRVTLAGGVYLPASVHAPPTPGSPALSAAALGLSPRQGDVLRLLIQGQPNKLICRTLALSESTVKTHLAAVFRLLEVNSRTQAVLAAARLGLHFPG